MTCREHDAQRQHINGWLVGEQEIRFDTVGSNTLANVPPPTLRTHPSMVKTALRNMA